MSEECISEGDSFDSLENLIQEYVCLVKKNQEGLPPYATFKELVDRPTKIKELIDNLNSENENEKLKAILELWATGGDIYVDGVYDVKKSNKLIHSVSNTARLQVFLKGGIKEDEKGIVLNKDNLLNFASAIGNYIKNFEPNDNSLKIEHNLDKNKDFKDLIKNNIDSVVNELLFWYYYDDGKYPIVNSRAKNSRKILNQALPKTKVSKDMDFNQKCLKFLGGIDDIENIEINGKKITKQLLLDQLFYSIDEMKSMKKVKDEYKDKNNEICKFYQKLWNTIREAKTNKKLQEYYNIFLKNFTYNKWYENAKELCENLKKIKKSKINVDVDIFVMKYFEEPINGIASIKGGQVSELKADEFKKFLRGNKNNDILFSNYQDINKLTDFLEQKIVDSKGSGVKQAVINRYLLTLYPENFTVIASGGLFNKLIKLLDSKLGIKIEGEGYIEQNNELMGIYLKNKDNKEEDIYKKKIFYWWLYKMLSDNLDLKKAIVYYGAPGTGKTYKAKKVAKQFIKTWNIKNGGIKSSIENPIAIQQFHPSFAYEDFMEGIRPTKDEGLKLQDGVFKKFCKKAGEIEITLWQNEAFREKFKEKSDFCSITVSEIKDLKNDEITELLKIDNIKDDKLKLLDIIPPAFFIIDEINRADLSRVFGELMYSLEYRGYEGKIKTQYSYLIKDEKDDASFFFENGENYFFIPQNIYIIGTMNTIDRSVDSFDFALRRRFSWEEIGPDYNVIRNELDPKIADAIAKSLEKLNGDDKKEQKVGIKNHPLLGADYRIGHSYALNLKHTNITNVKEAKEFLWENFIKSLLQEYFRGLGDSRTEIEKLKKAFYYDKK